MTRLPDVTAEQAAAMVSQRAAILVDVRTDQEWAEGHAIPASHIPLDKLDDEAILSDVSVLTICHTGRRSAIAADRLADDHQVHNVTGGMIAWVEADLPIAGTTPDQTSQPSE